MRFLTFPLAMHILMQKLLQSLSCSVPTWKFLCVNCCSCYLFGTDVWENKEDIGIPRFLNKVQDEDFRRGNADFPWIALPIAHSSCPFKSNLFLALKRILLITSDYTKDALMSQSSFSYLNFYKIM